MSTYSNVVQNNVGEPQAIHMKSFEIQSYDALSEILTRKIRSQVHGWAPSVFYSPDQIEFLDYFEPACIDFLYEAKHHYEEYGFFKNTDFAAFVNVILNNVSVEDQHACDVSQDVSLETTVLGDE